MWAQQIDGRYVFLTQLYSNAGVSVWKIMWITTNFSFLGLWFRASLIYTNICATDATQSSLFIIL